MKEILNFGSGSARPAHMIQAVRLATWATAHNLRGLEPGSYAEGVDEFSDARAPGATIATSDETTGAR
jgi:hypothetical protein